MITRAFAYIVALLLLPQIARGEDAPTLLRALGRDPALLSPPAYGPAQGFDEKGVRAIYIDAPAYRGKPTKVFAWLGLPKIEPGQRVPAMVLVHGGGGTAFAEWVRLWTSRGYAAIAMDNCGQIPRGSYGKWERSPHGGPPGWRVEEKLLDLPVTDQWQYHAVASIVLSNSLIRSLPEVDPDRVGITGISWGGYLTCIVAGVDSRFKLAVPVYGCGFYEDCVWGPDLAKMPAEKRQRWVSGWDPKSYLPDAKMPVLWVNGTNDFAYPMNAMQKSYRLPKGERTLSVTLRMPHAHGGAGENPPVIHAMADAVLKGGVPLPKLKRQGRDGNAAWAEFESAQPLKAGSLLYTKDLGPWQKRQWHATPAALNGGIVKAELPKGATVYYLNVTDPRGFEISSEHEEIKSAPPAADVPATSPARELLQTPATKPADRQNTSPQPQSRTKKQVEGWTVRVDDRLLIGPDADLGANALRFLEAKLVEIKLVVPPTPLAELQKVTIVLDLTCGRLGPMQYHPSAGWLRANGYPAELAKCVHLPRAADLATRRNVNEQPWVILHELAHAYHDQVLGFDEPRVTEAYRRFNESGRGESALLHDGRRVRHYALTDAKEFFAEMTEAYFGFNDFYPFNRAELKESEPELHELLASIWAGQRIKTVKGKP